MNFPTRSRELLDLVRCELRAEPKSGVNCKKSQSRYELRAKIETNAIFIKCACGDI